MFVICMVRIYLFMFNKYNFSLVYFIFFVLCICIHIYVHIFMYDSLLEITSDLPFGFQINNIISLSL